VTTDFEHPLSKRALEAFGSKGMEKMLLKYAIKLTSEARGRDLLHQALLVVCDPDVENHGKPWDPGRGAFLAHMRIVIHHIAQRGWRSAAARREVLDDELAAEASASDPDHAPDETVDHQRQHEDDRRLGTILRGRLSGLARDVFDRRCLDDEETAADIARALDCTVEEVYRANEKIAYHARNVVAEEKEAEDQRMKERKARAMESGGKMQVRKEHAR
jgi:hypothetical protein